MKDSKHATRVGSRIIPPLFPLRNVVEVECPSCSETVDLGSDSPGTYECPYCSEDFQYEVDPKAREERLIEAIEYEGLKPDYVLEEIRYIWATGGKILWTMLSIGFIPLFGIGLVMLWLIWEGGPNSDHVMVTVFVQEENLVLYYSLLNGEIEHSNSFELTEQSVITWQMLGGGEGGPSQINVLQRSSTSPSMILPQSIGGDKIREFAEYVDIDYMSLEEMIESN